MIGRVCHEYVHHIHVTQERSHESCLQGFCLWQIALTMTSLSTIPLPLRSWRAHHSSMRYDNLGASRVTFNFNPSDTISVRDNAVNGLAATAVRNSFKTNS